MFRLPPATRAARRCPPLPVTGLLRVRDLVSDLKVRHSPCPAELQAATPEKLHALSPDSMHISVSPKRVFQPFRLNAKISARIYVSGELLFQSAERHALHRAEVH